LYVALNNTNAGVFTVKFLVKQRLSENLLSLCQVGSCAITVAYSL